ncbi:MAG TPA: TIGR03089 family protein [Marmoricola sp.]|nr:TIGR03089 family protein [Marmoricola sp.]
MPPSTDAPTFSAALAEQLRRDASRPLVTFYDDATAERVELSVATYANWVAKTAGLLQDELGLERGGTVLVDLPTHWLGPAWLGAAWTVGLSVTTDPADAATADLVVCGPDGVGRRATGDVPVVALSLLPMAARFATPLPDGVLDYGVVVWGQPDGFVPLDAPTGDDLAWHEGPRGATQSELLVAARAATTGTPGTRLLTDANPCSAAGVESLLGPLLAGGGTVWVAHPDPAQWEHHARTEQATAQLLV